MAPLLSALTPTVVRLIGTLGKFPFRNSGSRVNNTMSWGKKTHLTETYIALNIKNGYQIITESKIHKIG